MAEYTQKMFPKVHCGNTEQIMYNTLWDTNIKTSSAETVRKLKWPFIRWNSKSVLASFILTLSPPEPRLRGCRPPEPRLRGCRSLQPGLRGLAMQMSARHRTVTEEGAETNLHRNPARIKNAILYNCATTQSLFICTNHVVNSHTSITNTPPLIRPSSLTNYSCETCFSNTLYSYHTGNDLYSKNLWLLSEEVSALLSFGIQPHLRYMAEVLPSKRKCRGEKPCIYLTPITVNRDMH